MSFYTKYKEYEGFDFSAFLSKVTSEEVMHALESENLCERDLLALLSIHADPFLELIAKKSQQLTLQNFGKVILLYTPMYLSNYCINQCVYCGFNASNSVQRKQLSFAEVELEAQAIAATGLRHILILTGESRYHAPVAYIKECVKILRNYFCSISIEIYPLEIEEYAELIAEGVDGLTIYQEIYNEKTYGDFHLKGPKKDYLYRLNTPERACKASIRNVNVGSLLGLEEWRKEAFFTALHARYLQDKYPDVELGISFPRMRPHAGQLKLQHEVSDRQLVQIMLATRMFIPRAGITISTRERPELRDNLIGLGVTKMSAGSSTEVGGHVFEEKSTAQFNISDGRSVEEIRQMIYSKNYQPVFKDWQII